MAENDHPRMRATETAPENYPIVCFIWASDENLTKYDFRTKSIEMALGLLLAINATIAKGISREGSITIGDLYFSFGSCSQQGFVERAEKAENIFNWEIL